MYDITEYLFVVPIVAESVTDSHSFIHRKRELDLLMIIHVVWPQNHINLQSLKFNSQFQQNIIKKMFIIRLPSIILKKAN